MTKNKHGSKIVKRLLPMVCTVPLIVACFMGNTIVDSENTTGEYEFPPATLTYLNRSTLYVENGGIVEGVDMPNTANKYFDEFSWDVLSPDEYDYGTMTIRDDGGILWEGNTGNQKFTIVDYPNYVIAPTSSDGNVLNLECWYYTGVFPSNQDVTFQFTITMQGKTRAGNYLEARTKTETYQKVFQIEDDIEFNILEYYYDILSEWEPVTIYYGEQRTPIPVYLVDSVVMTFEILGNVQSSEPTVFEIYQEGSVIPDYSEFSKACSTAVYDLGSNSSIVDAVPALLSPIETFLNIELFPDFKLSYFLMIAVAVLVFGVFLKTFVGG